MNHNIIPQLTPFLDSALLCFCFVLFAFGLSFLVCCGFGFGLYSFVLLWSVFDFVSGFVLFRFGFCFMLLLSFV